MVPAVNSHVGKLVLQNMGLSWGSLYFPEDLWQYLETFLAVTTRESLCYWHLVDQKQTLEASVQHNITPPANDYLPQRTSTTNQG